MIGQYQCNYINLYLMHCGTIDFSNTNKCRNAVQIKAAVDVSPLIYDYIQVMSTGLHVGRSCHIINK